MNIFALIMSGLNLSNAHLTQARVAYDRLVRFLLAFVLPALIICFLININVGRGNLAPWMGYVPYLIGLILTAIFLVIANSPDVLAIVAAASTMASRLSATIGTTKPTLWARYRNVMWLTVAWINIPCMYLGGVPAGANPMAVFAILITITIISIVSERTIWRKIVLWSAMGILAINLFSLVGQPMRFWFTGDTKHFGASKREIALTKAIDAQKSVEDTEIQRRLDRITEKLQQDRSIPESDRQFLKEQAAETSTLPKKLGELVSKVGSLTHHNDTPAPAEKAKSASKPAPQQIAKSAPAPAVAAPVQVAFTPAPEPTRPEICNHSSGMLQWESDFSSGAMVDIECTENTIVLRDRKTGTVFDVTSREWRYNSEHGDLHMGPASRGNIIAEGTMGTERGGVPIRLKKSFS